MVVNLRDLFPETAQLDQRSVNALLTALKNAFGSSFDYLNFKKSIQAMDQLGMDEATTFKSAFATASTMGITKEKLLNSAKKYTSILTKEKELFAEALKNQLYEKVEGKNSELDKVKLRIENNLRKIEELKHENATLQEAIDNADEHVAQAKLKIEARKNLFIEAYNAIEKTITSDITLIDKHL